MRGARLPHGLAAEPPTVQRGDLVISEIQKDPKGVPDSRGEWLELTNLTSKTINVEGWSLSDHGSDSHVVDLGGQLLLIPPGGRIVLGNEDDPPPERRDRDAVRVREVHASPTARTRSC